MNENITPELMEKAKTAGSPEELLTLAKESGVELTAEEAQSYYAQLHKTGELADDELDAVAGGSGCGPDSGPKRGYNDTCQYFECQDCGEKGPHEHTEANLVSWDVIAGYVSATCGNCAYFLISEYRCKNKHNR